MKRKITKAQYDALVDGLKVFYKADGDSYVLLIEGEDDDTGALRRALERERTDARTSKDRLAEVERQLREITDRDARGRNDIATLERSWQQQRDNDRAELEGRLSAKDKWICKSLITGNATTLAAKLCGEKAGLILLHIEKRLTVEFEGDTPKLRILDKAGQPSAMTIDDLEKEFVADTMFAGIIIASKASGGAGAGGSNGGSRGGASGSKKFAEMNDAERTALFRENPVEFRRQAEEAKREALKL